MRTTMNTVLAITVLVLAMFSAQMPVLNAREHGTPCDQDCLFLLAALNTVLDKALQADAYGLLLSNYMLKACVNPDLRDLHFVVYSTLQHYYNLLSEHRAAVHSDTLFTRLAVNLKRIETYAEKLHGCSHDKEASRALVTKIKLKVEQLVNKVEKLSEVVLQYIPATVKPEKDFYEPGETLKIILYKNASAVQVSRPLILLLPDMQIIPLNYTITITDETIQLDLEIPGAMLVEAMEPGHLTGRSTVSFLIALETDRGLRAIRIVKARYGTPGVQVFIPTVVKRGERVVVQIQADDYYSALIVLNEEPLLNATYFLQPGDNLIEIETGNGLIKVGLNRLRLCINATLRTVSRCFEYPFYVEPRYPDIDVHIPTSIVTWTGRFGIAIYSKEEVELYCTVSSGFESKSLKLRDEYYVELYTGLFPVQTLLITLRVLDPSGTFDEVVLTYSVTVVNLPSIFAFLLVVVLIPALLGERERVFVSIIVRSLREAGVSALPSIDRLHEELLKPYVTVFTSSIVKLYYKALGKIGLRLPAPFETLREHYYSTISTRVLPHTAKTLLWKLLVLAERDLYSTRKPKYEDVHKLYEDVLNAFAS